MCTMSVLQNIKRFQETKKHRKKLLHHFIMNDRWQKGVLIKNTYYCGLNKNKYAFLVESTSLADFNKLVGYHEIVE